MFYSDCEILYMAKKHGEELRSIPRTVNKRVKRLKTKKQNWIKGLASLLVSTFKAKV